MSSQVQVALSPPISKRPIFKDAFVEITKHIDDEDKPSFLVVIGFIENHKELVELTLTPFSKDGFVNYDNWTSIVEMTLGRPHLHIHGNSLFTLKHSGAKFELPAYQLGIADFRFVDDEVRYHILTDQSSVLDTTGYPLKDAIVFKNPDSSRFSNEQSPVYLGAKNIAVNTVKLQDREAITQVYTLPFKHTLNGQQRLSLYTSNELPNDSDIAYRIQNLCGTGNPYLFLEKKLGLFTYYESNNNKIAFTLQESFKKDLFEQLKFTIDNANLPREWKTTLMDTLLTRMANFVIYPELNDKNFIYSMVTLHENITKIIQTFYQIVNT